MSISTESVENPQNSAKQSGGIRLKWKAIDGTTCAGCIYELRQDCENVESPDGKDCLDKCHEDNKNWIIVEDAE